MLKVAIYSPYLDTFGGGERYVMTIAEVLCKNGNSVGVLLDNNLNKLGPEYLKNELSKRFDLNLNGVNFSKGPVGEGSNFFSRILFLKKYDVLFYLTDGSIFFSTSKRSILHIQSPLVGQPANSFWGKLKLKNWKKIIYNSNFTKKHSEKNWPIASEIIYPPVDVDKIKSLKKRKYILSVGRFFGFLKDKKQELLIKTYRELYEKRKIIGWSLHLAGSAQEGDKKYIQELKKLSPDLPVNFYPNIEYDDLIKLYGESGIYWHASGFGEDDPTKMEHFGISTVEAMSGGCVSIVYGKGGQVEIVEHGKNGYLWNSLDQLKSLTIDLINNPILRARLSRNATLRAREFDKKRFEDKIVRLLNSYE